VPFKSKSQRRLFHAKSDRGEISKAKVREWEHATKNKKSLPEHVKKFAIDDAYEAGVKQAMADAGLLK
jgi:hypothetical protein